MHQVIDKERTLKIVWYSEDIDDTECSLNWRVTYWMPLPPAPKQEEK